MQGSRNVESRLAFEDDLFDAIVVTLDDTGTTKIQRSAFGWETAHPSEQVRADRGSALTDFLRCIELAYFSPSRGKLLLCHLQEPGMRPPELRPLSQL